MIYNQSVFDPWPIERESVQAVITSPPYYALRKYDIPDVIIGGDKDCQHMWVSHEKKPAGGSGKNSNVGGNQDEFSNMRDGSYFSNSCIHCNAWKGQYGLEPTPLMYVEHSLLWAKEAWRVLRNDGIFFLNIGDSWNSTAVGTFNGGGKEFIGRDMSGISSIKTKKLIKGIKPKCQLLIPHRVAIALVDSGWTLRNSIIWHKPNAMPESVTDRFSKKYEYIFMFTKQERYYFDLDAIREPISENSIKRVNSFINNNEKFDNQKHKHAEFNCQSGMQVLENAINGEWLNKGKNPGDVWIIPTQPSSEKHYAMWPEKLVERMIKCSTKAGDTVLDPFCGSGSTLKVAEQLSRKGIGIDLGYHEISKRRTSKIQKELFV